MIKPETELHTIHIQDEEILNNNERLSDDIKISLLKHQNTFKIKMIIEEHERISKITFFVGFITLIIPFYWHIWLMNWINYRNSPSNEARRYAKYSHKSLVSYLILSLIIISIFLYGMIAFSFGFFINFRKN
jgi:hypothetical protein